MLLAEHLPNPVFAQDGFSEGGSIAPSGAGLTRDIFSDDSDLEASDSEDFDTDNISLQEDGPAAKWQKRSDDSGPAHTQITITDFTRPTYGAVLYYLHTGCIAFAPPLSRYILEGKAQERFPDYCARHAQFLGAPAWITSPKSTFRSGASIQSM